MAPDGSLSTLCTCVYGTHQLSLTRTLQAKKKKRECISGFDLDDGNVVIGFSSETHQRSLEEWLAGGSVSERARVPVLSR
jgi:hypothetical protein